MRNEGEGDFQFSFNEADLDAELAKILGEGEEGETQPKSEPKKKKLCRALVVAPIDAPVALRAALDMVGASAPVIDVGSGSAAYLEVEEEEAGDDAEMMALLGQSRPLPEEVDKMGRLLSKLTKHGAVVLASWVNPAPSDETADSPGDTPKSVALVGSMEARRYVNGEPEDSLAAGMVLSVMSLAAEELLLGRITVADVEGFSEGGNWSGWLKGRRR